MEDLLWRLDIPSLAWLAQCGDAWQIRDDTMIRGIEDLKGNSRVVKSNPPN